MMFGWKTNPHAGPFHILSFIFIGGGFILISAGWRVLYEAQRKHALAPTGVYAYVRHPQYIGFILVMFGFLLQWPTILTLAMFPFLVWMYVRLALTEERETQREFGDAYASYAAATPRWIPVLIATDPLEFTHEHVRTAPSTIITILDATALRRQAGGTVKSATRSAEWRSIPRRPNTARTTMGLAITSAAPDATINSSPSRRSI